MAAKPAPHRETAASADRTESSAPATSEESVAAGSSTAPPSCAGSKTRGFGRLKTWHTDLVRRVAKPALAIIRGCAGSGSAAKGLAFTLRFIGVVVATTTVLLTAGMGCGTPGCDASTAFDIEGYGNVCFSVSYGCTGNLPTGQSPCTTGSGDYASFTLDNKEGTTNDCTVQISCPDGQSQSLHVTWPKCSAPLVDDGAGTTHQQDSIVVCEPLADAGH